MDTMKAVSNEFDEIKNEENLGDETKSLAFFDICELNKGGTYGYVRLAMTNPTFFGIEVKIAIKTIKQVVINHQEKVKKEKEFDLLYKINHPNIMKAHKKWETGENQLKFAFEYLP